jgi:hypothetical protein
MAFLPRYDARIPIATSTIKTIVVVQPVGFEVPLANGRCSQRDSKTTTLRPSTRTWCPSIAT